MNLIHDPIVTIGRHAGDDLDSGNSRVSLPELLAAMTRGEVREFAGLRPHQRPAWHMFLVQLGALAAWAAGHDELPKDGAEWMRTLRALTPDDINDESWRLVVTDGAKPAFLQPPKPAGPGSEKLKWSPVTTPDALDLLITSRNHDLKGETARQAEPEDWMFALVSLQTSEGFGGAKNYGIARMNGGSSSRPMLALAPAAREEHVSVNPSAWWKRDVERLIATRRAGRGSAPGRAGGPALLWRLDWPEGKQLDLGDLDPWFIEICRRIRLVRTDGAISAQKSTSETARIDAKVFKGVVGDPWAPVHATEGKSFTLPRRGYDYKKLCELLFSGDWKRPLLAEPGAVETTNMLLIAEGISRGNSKTEGFHSRIVPLPRTLRLFSSNDAATLSKAQMEEIAEFDKALRDALSLVAAHGDRDAPKHFSPTNPARERFDRAADRLFFPSLWRRVEAAAAGDSEAQEAAETSFLSDLRKAAQLEFEAALTAVPCPTIHRPRAEARARRVFHGTIRKKYSWLYEKESADAAA